MEETHICSICQGEYVGFGNNAQPINDGRCCNDCNGIVIAARLRQMARRMAAVKTKGDMDEA